MFAILFFKQKRAYEMRISDWSSDVCSSDLQTEHLPLSAGGPWDLPALLGRGAECRMGAGVSLGEFPEPRRGARFREPAFRGDHAGGPWGRPGDRKSVVSGKSVSVRVGLGGRRIIK